MARSLQEFSRICVGILKYNTINIVKRNAKVLISKISCSADMYIRLNRITIQLQITRKYFHSLCITDNFLQDFFDKFP